jgi:hypothetical protein
MAGPTSRPNRGAITVLRAVAASDIALGVLAALAGESVLPLGEIVPGVRLWWIVGAVLAIGGVGILLHTVTLDRRRRDNAGGTDPVQRT